ncbi:MAG: tripartite tricarboxylate transporter TctB family protein [Fusobacteriaceae bacterium]|nr:tripartite tricarboxylate transporter TctB family protein [Fusobacteriaceae bacterium]
MNENKHLDFVTSLVLLIVSVFVLTSARTMYLEAKEPWHLSPALLPSILGTALLCCAATQLYYAVKGEGAGKRIKEFTAFLRSAAKDGDLWRMLGGIGILALYTFVGLLFLPFWAASAGFLLLLTVYLRAASLPKLCLMAAGVVGAVVLLFRVLFRVPLP